MTLLIVARGLSPGGAADPWTEGPNLIVNGDFETAMPDLPWDDPNWAAFFNNETVERITVSPITGTASLHVVTTGEANEHEGAEAIMADNSVTSRQPIRARFTITGTTGTVYAQVKFQDVGASAVFVTIYADEPGTEPKIVEADFIAPDAAEPGIAGSVRSWRPRLYFFSFNEIADFTIDEAYLGILTPA